jgi:hypothetical protein
MPTPMQAPLTNCKSLSLGWPEVWLGWVVGEPDVDVMSCWSGGRFTRERVGSVLTVNVNIESLGGHPGGLV